MEQFVIPLTGVGIGNGLTAPEIQYSYYGIYAVCPHTTIYMCRILVCVSVFYYMCGLIPSTATAAPTRSVCLSAIYVSSYCYIWVLMLLCIYPMKALFKLSGSILYRRRGQ
jgi:hypothetical protein